MSMPYLRQRRRYPLHIHIWTLAFALVVGAAFVIAYLSYSHLSATLEQASQSVFERIARETASELERLQGPAEAAIDLLALQRVIHAGSLEQRLDNLPFFREALRTSQTTAAVYIGYEDGAFFLVRRLSNDADRQMFGAPQGAAILVQSVDQSAAAPARGQFLYYDAELRMLRSEIRPDYAKFDPRSRSWYREAMASSRQIRTEPYVFFTTKQVGVTLAKKTQSGTSAVGADVSLAVLAEVLSRQKLTPSSEILLMDAGGKIIAHPDLAKVVRLSAGSTAAPARATLEQSGSPALLALAARLAEQPRTAGNALQKMQFDAGGRSWRASLTRLPVKSAREVFLALAVPDDELLADAKQLRRDSILATLLVILATVPLSLLMARAISRPLRDLALEAEAIRHFEFSQPVTVASFVREVDELAETMGGMKRAIRRFLDISYAVAAEDDFERLLPKLLDETISSAGADSGVLYLTGPDERTLIPAAVRLKGGGTPAGTLAQLSADAAPPIFAAALKLRHAHGAMLTREDIAAAGLSALLAGGAAEPAGIAVPLFNRQHKLVGAMLLLRAKAADPALISFIEAFSGLAAASLETRELIRAQKALFEAFIQLIAGAIDAKSPYTGGHCARVPELTKMLARAACDASTGPYKDFTLSEDEWEAVHVASWLHDCGKVTTPEYVVDKATKLETIYDRIHEVRMRFEVLKRDAEIASWRKIAEGGERAAMRAELEAEWKALDAEFAFVASCNEGGEFMAPERIERLQQVAGRTWLRTLDDRIGNSNEEKERKARIPVQPLPATEKLLADRPDHLFERRPQDRIPEDNRWGFRVKVPQLLYNRGELYNLSVGRGTLAEEDRYKINEHMIQTIIMLSALPFPKHLRQVPEIAGGHHEKMDGNGYPKRLKREDMSPVARMMAIADIFEALTAVDRPYKKGKTLSEAIKIMSLMKKDRHIDAELFDLFLTSGVYRRYAEKFLNPAQIDEVDISSYLSAAKG
jgi:HD-GYP domain-containing protein (c-di-GMP phosphodiesterase class II)